MLLNLDGDICMLCTSAVKKAQISVKRTSLNLNVPAKLNVPIAFTSPDRVLLRLREESTEKKALQIENISLKHEIKLLEEEISASSISVSSDLGSDFKPIMSNADPSKVSPLMKIFLEEKQKYRSSTKDIVCH